MSYATPQPPPNPRPQPQPVRVAIRYQPELGRRRVLIIDAEGNETDVSGSVERVHIADIDPRGPSSITLQLRAEVDGLDWVFQTVGVLGDPMARIDPEQLKAVIRTTLANSGFAEPPEQGVATAVVEHLRGVIGPGAS